MGRANRVDGVCQKCMLSRYDKHNRCMGCNTIARKARKLGITKEEAALLPFNFRDEVPPLTDEELSPKARYLRTEKGKAYARRNAASRRAKINNASILLDDEWNAFVIEEIYSLSARRDIETGIKWHVDHKIPLKGRLVCGLHVWYNLDLIPATINLTKNNKVV